MVKKVAVVGAGCSGLPTIKCCLDEGLEPTCFERTEDIGGLWRFKENPEEGRASIYNSVISNTSKEMTCYSDFPMPEDYPNYMHNSKLLQYFRLYAEHFKLLQYIRFKTTVCSIRKRPDFSMTGQWDVTSECNGKQQTEIFDAVLICIGHHCTQNLPLHNFPGIENFKGQYLHSRQYKNPHPFKNKRIIVVGIGNTAVDLVVELSSVAKQVYLSTRRGAWIVNRVCDNGYPLDTVQSTRFNCIVQGMIPVLTNKLIESKINARVNHDNYGLTPQHRFLSQQPTVSDTLPNRIISGKVLLKTNVKRFTETDVIFEDGTVEKDIDVVIFATGYVFSLPFLEESVLKVQNNEISLYKMIFPPNLEKPTLGCIGYIQPSGAFMPIAEMQARWATRVFKGLHQLPLVEGMRKEITERKQKIQSRYFKSKRHTLQVGYVSYMDEIATEIGCKPDVRKVMLADPKLGWELFFGPCSPYQYRLFGPGKWKGARQAILTQMDRIIKPTKTRVLKNDDITQASLPFGFKPFGFKILGILMVFVAMYAMI
ncbi:dimethylaniline monooxygenase [N-oxide-forming] 2 isoform X2 [Xenopus laevis]|nr:dimethylaniline monooxygenase [N-oxide-forming] 2 isoform X2 [Xenopus laevis]XP_018116549.1 dimethylaniline monooxygenase [N-oxide-forming] 2 isoform X2 [Xenopus laevis]XP_018116550.1 dimethylaniline monooxygenase [N-oxide-forming] 2 isoform X2 [Xenopus laevis]OCT82910.1 hypothetical protein XELAEV_18025445mg [Xenopus laevis]